MWQIIFPWSPCSPKSDFFLVYFGAHYQEIFDNAGFIDETKEVTTYDQPVESLLSTIKTNIQLITYTNNSKCSYVVLKA